MWRGELRGLACWVYLWRTLEQRKERRALLHRHKHIIPHAQNERHDPTENVYRSQTFRSDTQLWHHRQRSELSLSDPLAYDYVPRRLATQYPRSSIIVIIIQSIMPHFWSAQSEDRSQKTKTKTTTVTSSGLIDVGGGHRRSAPRQKAYAQI